MIKDLKVSVNVRFFRDDDEKEKYLKEKESILNESDFLDTIFSFDVKSKKVTFDENLKKKKMLESNEHYYTEPITIRSFFMIPSIHDRTFFINSIKKFYSIDYDLKKIENIPLDDMEKIIDNMELTDEFKCSANEMALDNIKGMLREDIERLREEMFERYIQDIPEKEEVLFTVEIS